MRKKVFIVLALAIIIVGSAYYISVGAGSTVLCATRSMKVPEEFYMISNSRQVSKILHHIEILSDEKNRMEPPETGVNGQFWNDFVVEEVSKTTDIVQGDSWIISERYLGAFADGNIGDISSGVWYRIDSSLYNYIDKVKKERN